MQPDEVSPANSGAGLLPPRATAQGRRKVKLGDASFGGLRVENIGPQSLSWDARDALNIAESIDGNATPFPP